MINHNAQKSSGFLNTLHDLSYMINHVMYFGLNQKPEHFTGLPDIMIKFLIAVRSICRLLQI